MRHCYFPPVASRRYVTCRNARGGSSVAECRVRRSLSGYGPLTAGRNGDDPFEPLEQDERPAWQGVTILWRRPRRNHQVGGIVFFQRRPGVYHQVGVFACAPIWKNGPAARDRRRDAP